MCRICDKARRMPPKDALNFIANAMKESTCENFDRLIGELIGEGSPEVDQELERDWWKARS